MPMNTYPTFEPSLPVYEGTQCSDNQLRTLQPPVGANNMHFGSDMFQPIPFEPILPGEWLTPATDNFQWAPALNSSNTAWDAPHSSYSSSYSSSPGSNYDPFGLMPGFNCEASPDFEAYSPPSTATSEIELPSSFDHFPANNAKSLPIVPPIVPSSSRETPPAPSRRVRRPSKESTKNIVDERKYQCDFCPVQMARLHDINRHMRIHTGVHPYACLGCGETFRRTDARTRHWCKQPECFKIHSAKAPASKVRRRIP
ncbi:hypothetical protein RSOLAG1IB_00874 [Rhizoctonia solani AG-1 IB]|uniref:C2H2-type domain-containing protein n=1 Tax=Thanatephorus cucumeris (strain AG1-IB / isolate 7/3/14) TaxID=1108050 RepID=M5BIC9_THACB|nr:hypothetical protein BN14_00156 [Rhizoctonia solani AG-1 IB]CEL52334.1 hypothetical protein RSOLAG1IB_00874 [Rhizoctonia solani AG-1 IB]